MSAFLCLSEAGLTSDQPGVAHTENEKDLVNPAESVIARPDPDSNANPGGLTFEEGKSRLTVFSASQRFADKMLIPDTAGGMGRHLGVFSCTMFMYPHFLAILKFLLIEFFSSIGRIIGTGIFSTPSSVLGSVGSVGASLSLWVAGFFLSFCGLFIWLEFGTMFPRSGGEKVYLEVVYRRPKYLATVIFSATTIILGLSAGACIVSPFPNAFMPFFMWLIFRSSLRSMNKDLCTGQKGLTIPISILVSAGHSSDRWVVRGIAIGGIQLTFSPKY